MRNIYKNNIFQQNSREIYGNKLIITKILLFKTN